MTNDELKAASAAAKDTAATLLDSTNHEIGTLAALVVALTAIIDDVIDNTATPPAAAAPAVEPTPTGNA